MLVLEGHLSPHFFIIAFSFGIAYRLLFSDSVLNFSYLLLDCFWLEMELAE